MTKQDPPYNSQAEQAILGILLIHPESMSELVGLLSPTDFYTNGHDCIYRSMLEVYETHGTFDIISINDALLKAGELKSIGEPGNKGNQYLLSIQSAAPAGYKRISDYGKLINNHSKLRQLISLFSFKINEAYKQPVVDEFIGDIEAEIFKLNNTAQENPAVLSEEIVDETLERLEHLFKSGDDITGLRTGYLELDDLLSGLQDNAMYIVGARPSMGKTAVALQMAADVAINQNKPVLLFSLEMSHMELMQRIICNQAGVNSKRLKNGDMYEEDWDKILAVLPKIAAAPLLIDDNPNLTIEELRAKTRRIKNRYKDLSLVVVDYLQLMAGSGGDRQNQISQISRGTKILAREIECPIMALSQLNRELESRNNKRPQLSDLRESGSQEQDADVVIFIYRDEIYNEESDAKGITELIVAKHRNGAIGTVRLGFLGEFTKFVNISKDR